MGSRQVDAHRLSLHRSGDKAGRSAAGSSARHPARHRAGREIIGLSYTGRSCLLTANVIGYSRVPEPPARMMPFIAYRLPDLEKGFRRNTRCSQHRPKGSLWHVARMARDRGHPACFLMPPDFVAASRLPVEAKAQLSQSPANFPVIEARQPAHGKNSCLDHQWAIK